MIQDIAPYHLDNAYQENTPKKGDTVFCFREGELLAGKDGENVQFLTFAQIPEKLQKACHWIFLFTVGEERFFFSLDLPENLYGDREDRVPDAVEGDLEADWLPEGFGFYPINIFRKMAPKHRAYAAITGFHLYNWYRDNRFCGRCGRKMKADHRERMMRCSCGNMVYPKISPSVIVAVQDRRDPAHSRLLLTKYAGGSYRQYALVAGFTEIGETLEETVQREVFEEVGLHVKNISYYKSQPWGLSGGILAGFWCELDGEDTITLQEEELSTARWFTADQIDLEADEVSLTREMILYFKQNN